MNSDNFFIWWLLFFGAIVSISLISNYFKSKDKDEIEYFIKEEEKKVNEINSLKRKLSASRDKLQKIRLGAYEPTPDELEKIIKLKTEDDTSQECFFCCERIHQNSLVCRFCGRPNVYNLSAVWKHDMRVRKNVN